MPKVIDPTVLAQSVQQGTVVSSSLAWANGSSIVTATAQMALADIQNPDLSLTMVVAASYDAQGLTFARQVVSPWVGGELDKSGNPTTSPPQVTWGPDPNHPPTFVRIEYDLTQPVSIGADVTLS